MISRNGRATCQRDVLRGLVDLLAQRSQFGVLAEFHLRSVVRVSQVPLRPRPCAFCHDAHPILDLPKESVYSGSMSAGPAAVTATVVKGAIRDGESPTLSTPFFGRYVMPKKGVEGVGELAVAYSALDDIAWLAAAGHIDPDEDYNALLGQIQNGMRVVTKHTGHGRKGT